ncbi:hypothetical protein K438DRAFT_119324 [Mycena galopus ATCC 62051]|nr:hypothetical protein K438DRAFT_119324 [Mycena galopus ATCC 62051]
MARACPGARPTGGAARAHPPVVLLRGSSAARASVAVPIRALVRAATATANVLSDVGDVLEDGRPAGDEEGLARIDGGEAEGSSASSCCLLLLLVGAASVDGEGEVISMGPALLHVARGGAKSLVSADDVHAERGHGHGHGVDGGLPLALSLVVDGVAGELSEGRSQSGRCDVVGREVDAFGASKLVIVIGHRRRGAEVAARLVADLLLCQHSAYEMTTGAGGEACALQSLCASCHIHSQRSTSLSSTTMSTGAGRGACRFHSLLALVQSAFRSASSDR